MFTPEAVVEQFAFNMKRRVTQFIVNIKKVRTWGGVPPVAERCDTATQQPRLENKFTWTGMRPTSVRINGSPAISP